jgi:polyisoprenoid-binding protein YceI
MKPVTGAEAAQGTRYAIDARGSRLTIHAYASGLLSGIGHDPVIAAREIAGEVMFAPDNAAAASVAVKVPVGSLAVQNDVSDKDRRDIERAMCEDVLELPKYPEIVYEASGTKVERLADTRFRVALDGQLILHGATRMQRVSAQVFLMGDTLRGQGEFTLRQTDFGIRLYSAAGGTLKIRDEVKCSFDLLARKAP